MTNTTPPETAEELVRTPGKLNGDHRRAMLAGFCGWLLDAFDFFLITFCLTAIAREFHRSDAAIALVITMTMAFRPIGGFVFGMLADRYGRRRPLMVNLALFAVVEVLTGLAPNYATLLVARSLFGVVMGGQWGVGASLVMEKAPAHSRGMFSGLLQEGYAAGNVLAALAFFLFFGRLGWRPLFFLGSLPALLLAVLIRFGVSESEVWEKARVQTWGEQLREMVSHWKLFLYLTVLMTMMKCVSHGTQDMYPTFLERQWHFGPSQRSVITGISMIGAILGSLVIGFLSDRYGRRRAMIGALLGGILMVPLWAYAPSTALLVLGAFLVQFMVQGSWGIIPAHLSELSPDSVRGFLPGFAYQCGVLVASSVVYIEAVFARTMTYATAMALTAVTVFALAAIVAAAGKERKGHVFGAGI